MPKPIGLKIFVNPDELQQITKLANGSQFDSRALQLVGRLIERLHFAALTSRPLRPSRDSQPSTLNHKPVSRS